MESKGKNSSPLVAVPMRRHLVTLSDAAFQQVAADAHLTYTSFVDVLEALSTRIIALIRRHQRQKPASSWCTWGG
jgi:hypothetical protein